MKIKTKKQMNLPQLIEWGFENNVRNECFLTHDSEGNTSEVHFDIRGLPKFSSMVDKNDTFTVEVEEEITEDKELILISRCVDGAGNVGYLYNKTTIENRLKHLPSAYNITHIYIENGDEELVLVWTHDKGLVE